MSTNMEQVFLIEKQIKPKVDYLGVHICYEAIGWTETEEDAQKTIDEMPGTRYRKIVKAIDHE